MKCTRDYYAEDDRFVMTFEFTGSDVRRAKFKDLDLKMLRALGEQQERDPTAEGALMIAQQYAAAIQRSMQEG